MKCRSIDEAANMLLFLIYIVLKIIIIYTSQYIYKKTCTLMRKKNCNIKFKTKKL